jgi:hypothetical protein
LQQPSFLSFLAGPTHAFFLFVSFLLFFSSQPLSIYFLFSFLQLGRSGCGVGRAGGGSVLPWRGWDLQQHMDRVTARAVHGWAGQPFFLLWPDLFYPWIFSSSLSSFLFFL